MRDNDRREILAVQEAMLADLTTVERERYDAVRQASRVTTDDPNGLVYCETCGYMFDAISYVTHRHG